MDSDLKWVLMVLGSAIGIIALVLVLVLVAGNNREQQFRDTIKEMDSKNACGYTCYHNWNQMGFEAQYKDCLDYCKEGVNEKTK
jgi:hypothetical protein